MFTTKVVLVNEQTNEIFVQGDDVRVGFENGTLLVGYIEEVDSAYDNIQIGAPFLEENIKIDTSDITSIEKIRFQKVSKK